MRDLREAVWKVTGVPWTLYGGYGRCQELTVAGKKLPEDDVKLQDAGSASAAVTCVPAPSQQNREVLVGLRQVRVDRGSCRSDRPQ